MTPEEIKRRLKATQEANAAAKAERAARAKARDEAQEAWASSENPDDTSSETFVAARDATAAVDQVDDQIHAGEDRERDILTMLAQRDPDAFEAITRQDEDPAQAGPFNLAQHVRGSIIAPNAELLAGLSKGGAVTRTELGTIPRDVTAALLTTAGLNGAVPRDNRGIVQPIFEDPLVIQQIGSGTTDSNLIEYWQTAYTRVAAGVAEGALKPEATLSLVKQDAPVRTIAVWIPATRQALADLPGLESMVGGLLEDDVNQAVDEQVVAGDGLGDDLLGLLNHSNIGNVAVAYKGDLIRGIRRGITRVRQGKGRPNFVALNPLDWEEIVLTREDMTSTDGTGQYLVVGPGIGTEAATLWRLRVVESESIPQNSPLVGDGRGASLLVREDTTVALSEHDNVNFRHNLVTVRAEARVTLPVWRPGFFCEVVRSTTAPV